MGFIDDEIEANMARTREEGQGPGLREDLERLSAQLGGFEDFLARMEKRLQPILRPDVPTAVSGPTSAERDPGARSEVRAQIHGLTRTVARLQGQMNTLIGRVDL